MTLRDDATRCDDTTRRDDTTSCDDNLRLMTTSWMTANPMTAERINECCLRCYVRWKDLRR
jgi:hypothetical protein